MKIDALMSSIDPEGLNKDCILHSVLRIFFAKKAELSSGNDDKTMMLREQLEEYSGVITRLLRHAKCFPASCDNCEGLTKCIECIIKNKCVDAHLMFYKLIALEAPV